MRSGQIAKSVLIRFKKIHKHVLLPSWIRVHSHPCPSPPKTGSGCQGCPPGNSNFSTDRLCGIFARVIIFQFNNNEKLPWQPLVTWRTYTPSEEWTIHKAVAWKLCGFFLFCFVFYENKQVKVKERVWRGLETGGWGGRWLLSVPWDSRKWWHLFPQPYRLVHRNTQIAHYSSLSDQCGPSHLTHVS